LHMGSGMLSFIKMSWHFISLKYLVSRTIS
jgi:hypothetical protein